MANWKDWLVRKLGRGAEEEADAANTLQIAVAALLVEIQRADFEEGAGERAQVRASLAALFGLEDGAARALLERAERAAEEANDLYQFTSRVNRSYTQEEKIRLLEQLWLVARADEVVHKYEEHVLRRIADLLHVPHAAFIAAKLRSAG